jgi:hypothetical protein
VKKPFVSEGKIFKLRSSCVSNAERTVNGANIFPLFFENWECVCWLSWRRYEVVLNINCHKFDIYLAAFSIRNKFVLNVYRENKGNRAFQKFQREASMT